MSVLTLSQLLFMSVASTAQQGAEGGRLRRALGFAVMWTEPADLVSGLAGARIYE